MKRLAKDLWQEQRILVLTGAGFFILTGILTVLLVSDQTQILGINRWIKPIKFSSSIAIYLLTLAVFLYYLPGYEKSKNIIAGGAILFMLGEIFLITMQAARGTTSHFNIAEPFDAMVFSAMGLMILTNTLLIIYLTFLYFRADIKLPGAVVWGMRLGLIVFVLGSVQGGYLSSQTGHAVGVPDGGAGLPFLNWSTVGGDLRVAHFLGLHAFQAIPLFALAMVSLKEKASFIKPTIFTVFFSVFYFLAFTFVFGQALLGKPLVRSENAENTQTRFIRGPR